MTALDRLFADYDHYHRDRRNQVAHYVGIPVIVGTLLGLLLRWDFATVGRFGLSAGYVLLGGATLYYAALAPRLALPMLAAASFLGTVGRTLPVKLAAALFVAGWILQFVGHLRFENNSPAFVKNAGHLLIGPLWVLHKAMGR